MMASSRISNLLFWRGMSLLNLIALKRIILWPLENFMFNLFRNDLFFPLYLPYWLYDRHPRICDLSSRLVWCKCQKYEFTPSTGATRCHWGGEDIPELFGDFKTEAQNPRIPPPPELELLRENRETLDQTNSVYCPPQDIWWQPGLWT